MSVLFVDPGETAGWAISDDAGDVLDAGQTPLWQFADYVHEAVTIDEPKRPENPLWPALSGCERFVMEAFNLYPWKAKSMAWDPFLTVRLIGALLFIARQNSIPVDFQPASIKEAAEAAGARELFLSPLHPNRHANDALMHLTYWHMKQRTQ